MKVQGVIALVVLLAASVPVIAAVNDLARVGDETGDYRPRVRRLMVRVMVWQASVAVAMALLGSPMWWVPLAGVLPVLSVTSLPAVRPGATPARESDLGSPGND